jgi:hypothetical protein
MTQTPRTDARVRNELDMVPADFARQLERENADMRKTLQEISETAQKYRFEMVEKESYSVLTNIGSMADFSIEREGAA